MIKVITIITLLVSVGAYAFFFLAIELELKFSLENIAVNGDRLIDTSFRIRKFISLQFFAFLFPVILSLYLLLRSKRSAS